MKCDGCGKNETVPVGKSLPDGWIESFNPLFGKDWTAIACSHRCVIKKRIKDIGRFASGGPEAGLENQRLSNDGQSSIL